MRAKPYRTFNASDKADRDRPKIESFREYYTGAMYILARTDDKTHISHSQPGDFGHGQRALIHIEDGKNYKDMLFPSLEVLKEGGSSPAISSFTMFASRGKEIIEKQLSRYQEANPDSILVGKSPFRYPRAENRRHDEDHGNQGEAEHE